MTSARAALLFVACALPACGSSPPAAAPNGPAATAAPAATPNSAANASGSGCPTVAAAATPPVPPAASAATVAASSVPSAPSPDVTSAEGGSAEDEQLLAQATGPAIGGPKNGRPCEFHESVDSYRRRCSTIKNPDGSLLVQAKGTQLNPDNGFEFTLHGGPNSFVARGTLNAFDRCAGPFVARALAIIDNGVMTYELRFKEHCKIVVR